MISKQYINDFLENSAVGLSAYETPANPPMKDVDGDDVEETEFSGENTNIQGTDSPIDFVTTGKDQNLAALG